MQTSLRGSGANPYSTGASPRVTRQRRHGVKERRYDGKSCGASSIGFPCGVRLAAASHASW